VTAPFEEAAVREHQARGVEGSVDAGGREKLDLLGGPDLSL
jgi:hypothetical protein